MTEQEKLLQAKIPGQETGIEVKRSLLLHLRAFVPLRHQCLCKGWQGA